MSSIVLSNPFVTVPPPSQAATEGPLVPVLPTQVAPATSGSGARGSGDAPGHSGTGSGQGRSLGSVSQQAVLTDRRGALAADRPPNATAGSVVGAQTSGGAQAPAPQADMRDAELRRSAPSVPQGTIAPSVIDADMPDPLPTLPFLKMMSRRG